MFIKLRLSSVTVKCNWPFVRWEAGTSTTENEYLVCKHSRGYRTILDIKLTHKPLKFGIDSFIILLAMTIKRGDFVHAVREKLENSLEVTASDSRLPPYLFETKGEVMETKGDYAFVKFGRVPTPAIWLRIDQLEPAK